MIKFFRKIRHKLLSEGKTGRYLKYAIGEVVLVVIGILIALQINNWNESRKNLKIEMRYLKALKSEFAQNLVLIDESMESYKYIKATSEKLLKLTGEKRMEITEKELAPIMNESFARNIRYSPSPSIIQDLINSGSLASLNNDTLRIQLSGWYGILEHAKRQEEEIFEQRNAIIELMLFQTPFLNSLRDDGTGAFYTPLSYGSNFQGDTREILNDRQFENRLAYYIVSLLGATHVTHNEIKAHCERTLVTIENEIIARQK